MENLFLVVGLGNPGAEYAKHRHNAGFMAVDRWMAKLAPFSAWTNKWNGQVMAGQLGGSKVWALKPQTYMNRSGQPVRAAVDFLKVPSSRVIVVHDELDFELGRMAVKMGGGHGGHNGLRDIAAVLGSGEFVRIRLGIGRPSRGNQDVSGWVLSAFAREDEAVVSAMLDRAGEVLDCLVQEGVKPAMNRFNQA